LASGLRSINYALLFFSCVLFHVIGTWSLPLIDRDEPRFAEASREMIERDDYIVPYFNNQLRLDKPPLTYWAQVASYGIFGENDFAARFPSALAAAVTALLILAWGCKIGGEKLGWYAAIIFTLSLQTFVHAKAAVADMLLVLFVTRAHWSGYELIKLSRSEADSTSQRFSDLTIHRSSFWWWTFYVSLAVGFLAKGPIAWTPLLTVGAIIVSARDRQLARRFKFVRGILLMLTMIALWAIPALIATQGEFFTVGIGRHVIGRSLATMEGHGANSIGMYVLLLPFYFVTVFVSFFPWSIKLPWLTRKLWRETKTGVDTPHGHRSIDRYLVAGIGIVFIIFTLVSTKLPHYTLPAFPLLALLLARHWGSARFQRAAFGILPNASPQEISARQDAEHGRLEAGAARPLESRRSLFGTIAITTACVWIAIALFLPPMVARFFPAYQLFQQSRAALQPNMQFASVEFQEPSLVWYFRSRVHGFLTPLNKRRAVEFTSAPGPRFIVLPTPLAGSLFANAPQSCQLYTTSGFNIAKGKRLDLTLVLKPE
jgi:4-amino-4-deoxy-L-arabinose transferase-like glycosyltransferase